MLEFEEIIKTLNELKNRLESLGESLWHTKFRKKITGIRRTNFKTRILGRYRKYKKGIIRNKKNKK